MQVQDDETLPRDLERVGRWFWLTLCVGGALRVAEFPVLLPVFGVVLLMALHRLGQGPDRESVRPEVALPAVAVVAVELVTFASLLPFVADGVVVAITSMVTMAGIGSYVMALADFVRRAGLDDGRSIDHRALQWWATAAVLVIGTAVVMSLVATDVVPLGDGWSWGWTLVFGAAIAGSIVSFRGLYCVGHAQWEV